jgi:putative glycosyltransferase (TIGR04348 family)
MLRDRFNLIVQSEWCGARADAMIALHARRSADSIRAYRTSHKGRLAVVLTGTDLYRDLPDDIDAVHSLRCADRLVVLQGAALELLSPADRAKADVIFQSAPPMPMRAKARGRLDCVVVGHLREEKDPRTLFAAMAHLPADAAVTIRHIGAPLDASLARQARALARRDGRYTFEGAASHRVARTAMARAHVLVHPSIAEGGANVIVEAITAGTPVIASRISGNVGMLGDDYPGYFEVGDEVALASRLLQALRDPAYLRTLRAACRKRRALFAPAREKRCLHQVVSKLLAA